MACDFWSSLLSSACSRLRMRQPMVSTRLTCLFRGRSPALASNVNLIYLPYQYNLRLLVTVEIMFARCGPRQAARRVVRSIRSSHQLPTKRRYSNSSVAPSTDAPSSGAALGGLNTELDKLSPRFDISSSQIEILRSPSDFYETLKAS